MAILNSYLILSMDTFLLNNTYELKIWISKRTTTNVSREIPTEYHVLFLCILIVGPLTTPNSTF